MSALRDFSKDLTNQISELRVLDVNELAFTIEMRVKLFIKDLVNEYATDAEIEYQKQKAELMKHKHGTSGYLIAANKLSVIKDRKKLANRAANDDKRKDEYDGFKTFIKERFGQSILDEWFSFNQEKKEPVFSQKIDFIDFEKELLK